MDYSEAINKLRDLISVSQGRPIEVIAGKMRSFRLVRRYSLDDISEYESAIGFRLPEDYRNFMLEIGACDLYSGGEKTANGIVFPELNLLKSRYFEPLGIEVGSDFFPIAEDLRLQELAVFRMSLAEGRGFFNVSHEYCVEDWSDVIDELNGWKRFEDWVIEFVSLDGKSPVH